MAFLAWSDMYPYSNLIDVELVALSCLICTKRTAATTGFFCVRQRHPPSPFLQRPISMVWRVASREYVLKFFSMACDLYPFFVRVKSLENENASTLLAKPHPFLAHVLFPVRKDMGGETITVPVF